LGRVYPGPSTTLTYDLDPVQVSVTFRLALKYSDALKQDSLGRDLEALRNPLRASQWHFWRWLVRMKRPAPSVAPPEPLSLQYIKNKKKTKSKQKVLTNQK